MLRNTPKRLFRPKLSIPMPQQPVYYNLDEFKSKQHFNLSHFSQNIKELPWGEVPSELNFERVYQTSTLSNGINVTSVDSTSPMVTITCFIKCGSVNEKKEASGCAHFLEHMHFKGTERRDKNRLEMEIEENGGNLNAYTTREYTSYILNLNEDKINWGVDILSDILINSLYPNNLIERERSTIHTELLECLKEEFESTLEFSHDISFKNHALGRPILGLRENIMSVTREQIVDYHDLNYTGDNLIFVVSGRASHEVMCGIIEAKFGHLPKHKPVNNPELLFNLTKPVFNPGTQLIEGPEGDLKMGLYWEAPTWYDPDYIPFMILQRITGDYKKFNFDVSNDESNFVNFNAVASRHQYINEIQSAFCPYKKSALFGFYIQGDADRGIDMYNFLLNYVNDLVDKISDEDVIEARSTLLGELMMIENGTDLTQDIANYLCYVNRIVCKAEMAKRVSLAAHPDIIKDSIKKYIANKPFSCTVWGTREEGIKVAELHANGRDIHFDKTE